VDSTAFPQFTVDEFALPEFNSSQDVQNAAAMRAAVERGCLKKERYDRWPVRVGDMALFTQATMVCVPFARHLCSLLAHVPTELYLIVSHFRVLFARGRYFSSISAPRTISCTNAWRCSVCSRRSKRSARTTIR